MHKETMKYLMKLIHDECGGDKTCVDALWDEIHSEKIFSNNGDEAVQEIFTLLGDKYNITKCKFKDKKTGKNTDDAYYIIKNDKGIAIVLENHIHKNTYPGLITTHFETKEYSREGIEEINEWDKYGRCTKRKQFDYRGKNINKTMSMIDKILS